MRYQITGDAIPKSVDLFLSVRWLFQTHDLSPFCNRS